VGGILVVVAAVGWYQFHGVGPTTAKQSSKRAGSGGPTPVMTKAAKAEDFAIRRRTIGIIESPAVVVVKSRIDSQVTAQHVRDGQGVRQGDVLFTLDDSQIRAAIARDEAQIEKDLAVVDRTKADLARYERLADTNAAPRQQLDLAAAEHKIALATLAADQAQLHADTLRLSYTKVEAPISGRLGAIRVTPGNLVSSNDAAGLVTITQVRPIRVGFTLAERDLAALRRAAFAKPPAAVRVYTAGVAEPLDTGQLEFVDSAVDTASGTIAAKAKFANEKFALWPGMYVDVEIDLSVRPNTVMIPAVAIQTGQSGPFVFVTKDGQKVEMRKIEVLGIEGQMAALVSGVSANDRIVVEGQMRLVDGGRIVEASPAGPRRKVSEAAGESK
jgi:multidrug efflux system membrane fusion protein